MFSVNQESAEGFEIFILQDEDNGCFAEIIPRSGGTLHAFGVSTPEGVINIIDHYRSSDEFKTHVETLGYKSCKLSPFVCRMKDSTYSFGGHSYTLQHGYGPHALHGLLYKKEFSVVDRQADDQHASLKISYAYTNEDPGYPFSYDCVITYTLQNDYRLRLQTQIVNHSEGLMPIQDGWHPYFNLGGKVDELELEVQSLNRVVFDNDLIPTGEKVKDDTYGSLRKIGNIHLDNCYELDQQECQPLCVLRNPGNGLEVQFFPEKSYPFLQIYTPDHRGSIAIENISGPPDGFNSGDGFITLERNEKAIFDTCYKIKFLK